MTSPECFEEGRSGLAKGSSLPEEALQAFGTERNIRVSGSKSNLTWLYQQCLSAVECEKGVEDEKSKAELLHKLYTGDRSKLNIFDKQTYAKWKSLMEFEKVKHPVRHRRKVVLIQPILWNERHGISTTGQDKDDSQEGEKLEVGYGHTQISDAILDLLRQFCGAFYYGMEIRLAPSLDLADIPKLTSRIHQLTNRRQFLVKDIVDFLCKNKLKKCYCVLGVTVVDLYPGPEWNFVLGQAYLDRGCGVFSFGRYFNSQVVSVSAGLLVDTPLEPPESVSGKKRESKEFESEQMKNIWILMRVMSHELGHLLGLAHCHYFECAMNESSSIVEAARQPLFLCPICLRKLLKVLHCDPRDRYWAMMEVVGKIRRAGPTLRPQGPAPDVLRTEDQVVPIANSNDCMPALDSEPSPPLSSLARRRTPGGGEDDVDKMSREAEDGLVHGEEQMAMLSAAMRWLGRAHDSLSVFLGREHRVT